MATSVVVDSLNWAEDEAPSREDEAALGRVCEYAVELMGIDTLAPGVGSLGLPVGMASPVETCAREVDGDWSR